jgi:aminoglycoside 2''-phosphotransferase
MVLKYRGNVITIDARLELFKKQFPKEKIKSVQEREGSDHSVLEINHTWMCKSSTTQEGIALLEREVKALNLLQGKIDVAIPVPVHYEDNFLVYKKISGSPLIPYAFARYGNKQRSKLMLEVAQFLTQLHKALTPEEITSLNLTQSDWPWSLEKLQAHRHYLADNKDLADVFDIIMSIYQEEMVVSFQPTLIHNDMSFKNIIVDPLTGQLRGIIDFTDIAFDDPQLDLRMRRENPSDYARALGMIYAMVNDPEHNPQKLYIYYFATEFSRYFQYLKDENTKEAQEILNGIITSIREFMTSHDDCNKDEPCAHDEQEAVAEAA